MTRKIQEELKNVSNLVELHESNLKLLKDYEIQLVRYYQELLTNTGKPGINPPKPPSRTVFSSSLGPD